ncbi:MAG TPA: cytochrome c biogenesis protein CcsA [Candidatus Saccharimonadales bacterium]|nr:cytochrome c biogenesis protein CcsA [Candidatus Saccharimonadales bacterium]
MHNLEKSISEWRKSAATNVSADTLDELETHLRETTEQLVRSGMNPPDAFQRALANLGNMPRIASEFRKLNQPLWLPVKLTIGVTALLALILAIFLIARLDSGRSSLVLAAHVFTISLGYTLTLLIGGLGICFVSQRCVEDFSTSRLHSIARLSLVLGSVALCLTTLGVLLAMVWAKIEWGRYWAWDAKEIGGFSVVVWLVCYLVAHRFFKRSERGVLAISMLGNIVVSLAWVGPQVYGLHQYGTPATLLLSIAILINLAFFAIGFVPAGRLRIRNDG